ncbi:uncharacterized protein UDID_17542 [Ustilago sp. UG-2017a]|nr:uncharacterized protein UDID_17542 [Ustilago sp. UG-2017a]
MSVFEVFLLSMMVVLLLNDDDDPNAGVGRRSETAWETRGSTLRDRSSRSLDLRRDTPTPLSSRHARTLSSSSSGPSSPGRPQQSDENGRISPSLSYLDEYDPLPLLSSASIQGKTGPLETTSNLDAGLTSSATHLGTTSPVTPSVHVQTSSLAMSTCSRTLNRAGSVCKQRMTNPLNTPVPVEMLNCSSGSQGDQSQDLHTSFYTARSNLHQQARAHNGKEPRSASLLKRRAATAAVVGSGSAANAFCAGIVGLGKRRVLTEFIEIGSIEVLQHYLSELVQV